VLSIILAAALIKIKGFFPKICNFINYLHFNGFYHIRPEKTEKAGDSAAGIPGFPNCSLQGLK
jgi:hypothetical protein